MTKKMMIGSISAVVAVLLGAIAFGAYYLTQQTPPISIDESAKIDFTTKLGRADGASQAKHTFIFSYEEFETFVNTYGEITVDDKNALEYFNEEFFKEKTIAVFVDVVYSSHDSYNIKAVTLKDKKATVHIDHTQRSSGGVFAPSTRFTFIILDKRVEDADFSFTTKKIDNTPDVPVSYKPIIYLYPTKTTEVDVTLLEQEQITCSYPKYTEGWKVKAEPNGDLIDLSTNRELYALYYESENIEDFKVEKDGFVVKGEESIAFLEEKLEILGLTPREAEEFIVYWLPKLEANNYNYIRFATMEEINRNMPLEIAPNPDTLIRVLMIYKGLDNPIDVEEQKLITPERKGFVAVEWGGTEI